MEIYLKLFEVLFPVFFIVGIGYYLGKKNPNFDNSFITSFASNVGTPAMVIYACLLYTSDAADDSLRVDLGGRRII